MSVLSKRRSIPPELLLLTLALGLGSCSKRPSQGMLELRASRDAIRAAQSWQQDVGVQLPTGQELIVSLEKVECPARIDRITMLRDPHSRTAHEVSFDGILYEDLDAVQRSGEVRPGKPAISSDSAGIWWEVALAKGAPPHYTVRIRPSIR